MTLPTLVAFGALAPWPTPDRLDQIRNALQHQESLNPIVTAVRELPLLWKALRSADPILGSIEGEVAADQLAHWVTGAGSALVVKDKGNIARLPLTILTQITQYANYLRHCVGPDGHESIIKSVAAGGGIQGFCIGLLSALAVASAKAEIDVGNFAAISVRLAFCVGAYVDLDRHRNGGDSKAITLAVRWKADTVLEHVQALLSRHPDSYIAVVRDSRDVTITVPASVLEHVLEDLSQTGASVRDTGISGRYHSPVHAGVPRKILETCQAHFKPIFEGQSLVRSNTDAQLFPAEDTAFLALGTIMGEPADWYSTISTATSASNQNGANPLILPIGTDAVPQSIAKKNSLVKATIFADQVNGVITGSGTSELAPETKVSITQAYPEDAIAIIGMSCRFPGADSINEFWDLLVEGKNMLSEVPEARFGRNRSARSNHNLRYWGNFLRDIEAFDHGFFKKSPREAISMDPQQRILLEIAYEALESSGYFAQSSQPADVGCYIGACAVDYDFNLGCHPPSAYSATGTLRSFLSGKLSHYFGWSGPSLVLDTACSSSAVAIHTACTALKTGQCSQAIAGGITLMTSPYIYENFSAAHFLSATGGSKPFSADADGYCRGEGGGLVVLKRLSDAVADNDHIFSVIAGSAVNQNDNCVPITVPHTSSQGNLYGRVVKQAGVMPDQINFVEAHGTGTPVGDPIEMESIRRVFGGSNRETPLIVSSAKGNIGHTEGASGVAALIKATLQMEHRLAPRQALFKTLNPKIPPLEPDKVCIPVSNLALSDGRLAACVNNYGAAGSNAAMIVLEAPRNSASYPHSISPPLRKYPIRLAAASVGSLLLYCKTLNEFCDQLRCARDPSEPSRILSDLAFNLATKLNHELPCKFTVSITSLDQLQAQLRQQTAKCNAFKQRPKKPPVVLCFGGQVSDRVALDKNLWQKSTLLRSHLDACDSTLREMGYPGLYPGIFQTEPVVDIVVLHSIIFATQYSCAKAWLDSGLEVDALIGHSLGQLTALCISGVLSLADGLKLVAGRAALMEDYWGSESGTMIAVEADQQTLEDLQANFYASDTNRSMEIACFNGPTSHVVVSDKASAGEFEQKLLERGIRHKRLDVPYGFHSRFTEPLLPHLEDLASSLNFHRPIIALETCTDGEIWPQPSAKLIRAHTREPVFFGQAVRRLDTRFGPCTWLEAGSDSSVTNMVRRAIGQSSATANSFVPLQLNKPNATDFIVDATVTLWNAGHQVQLWDFHRSQRLQYNHISLPPYTWEKSKHWLELDASVALNPNDKIRPYPATNPMPQAKPPPVLLQLESVDSCGHHFAIDTSSEEYQTMVEDLTSFNSPVCPSSLYVELVSRAVRIADESKGGELLSIQKLQIYSSLSLGPPPTIGLNLQRHVHSWNFRIASTDAIETGPNPPQEMRYAEGTVLLKAADESLDEEFSRYERLIGHDKIVSVADDSRSESLRGNVMYTMLARAIRYPEWYRGIRSIAAIDSRIVAKVAKPSRVPKIISENTTTQLPILESFLQVASLHANCLVERMGEEVFQFSGADYLQWAPGFELCPDDQSGEISWDIVAYSSANVGKAAYDIFVYNAVTARLVLLMLGVHFTGSRLLGTPPVGTSQRTPTTTDANAENSQMSQPLALPKRLPHSSGQSKDAKMSIYDDICGLLEKLADIGKDEVSGDVSFDDIGVDSLMMIEVVDELSTLFRVDLPINELEELTDIDSLVNYLQRKGCVGSSFVEDDGNASPSSSSQTPSSTEPSLSLHSSEESAMTTPPRESPPTECVGSFIASLQPCRARVAIHETGTEPLHLSPHGIQQAFKRLRFDFEKHAEKTGAKGFWTNVYPQQADLVCAFVVEAYRDLSCDLANLGPGQQVPSINALTRHKHLVKQLQNILVDNEILKPGSNQVHFRTTKTIDLTSTAIRYERMLQRHPTFASETKLLNATGAHLAKCLTGLVDPLSLLFGDRQNRELLADFYANSQMLKAATHLLADFVNSIFSAKQSDGKLCILEVGAGTGGTTRYLVESLARCGVPFEYYFTDVSQSLVSQAKRKLSHYPQMRFMTFDCDREAPQELLSKFHIVISTNCIHATSNITTSTANILHTIRDDGALCLLEFTKNLYWFDLVFGLLEGWWLFSDGRQHALANEWFWDRSLRTAGFKHVSWTDGEAEEAKTLRLICAFKGEAEEDRNPAIASGTITKRAGVPMEELVWKRIGTLDLSADVYFPKTPDPPGKRRAIALLIHGGGHFLFGRKDIPMKHIRTLIERSFLPVSIDYRLCPETTLFEGPMTDCCDALKWVTETLPTLSLSGPAVRPDPTKVVSLGWSSGGQLAMSLGYAAPPRGIRAPDAVLAMYPPSDMESDHWDKPCYPLAAEEEPTDIQDLLAGVREYPIIEYAPASEKKTMALSLTLKDDRARIILHMCWNSQTIPVLVHGLPSPSRVVATDTTDWKHLAAASAEQVQAISPLWHIKQGNYTTPTFIVHGDNDDWLPLAMNERTIKELKERGVKAGLAVPEQCRHAFDLFPVGDPLGVGWKAIEEGYEFLERQLGMI